MYNHEPKDYICPFCLLVHGVENENVISNQEDIIYRDEYVTAFIGAEWWRNNKGHVMIIPNKHFENIYELPNEFSSKIHELERAVAIALKEVYKCEGVSSRQHNEPSGNQVVWHYHLHVFPRYKDDNLYFMKGERTDPKERAEYAKRLRTHFNV